MLWKDFVDLVYISKIPWLVISLNILIILKKYTKQHQENLALKTIRIISTMPCPDVFNLHAAYIVFISFLNKQEEKQMLCVCEALKRSMNIKA